MKQLTRTTIFPVLLVLVLAFSACGGPGDTARLEEQPAQGESIPIFSPCEVTGEMVGQELIVAGRIEFIDRGDPMGLFVGLTDGGCLLGVFLEKAAIDEWSESQQAAVREGEQAEFSGTLTQFGGELVLEVYAQQAAPDDKADEQAPAGGQAAAIDVQVSDNPESRRQEFTLTFMDDNGNPVPGLEVKIDQVDIDFFYDSSNCPQCAWTEITDDQYQWNTLQKPNAKEIIHDYLDLGFNAEIAYFGNWWKEVETVNNEWNPILCQFSLGEYPCFGAVQGEILEENPVPNRFFYADLGPDFRLNHSREVWRPAWLDINTEATFKAEFEEYLAEVIRRGEINFNGYDFYMIGYESAGGSDLLPWSSAEMHSDQWVKEWVDFFDWQIQTIHKYDPDAVIGLNLHSIGWNREIMNLPENMAPQPWIEGLIAKGADFDIIGFEIHPGASSCEGDSREFNQQFLDVFKQYGKKIYIWEYAVSSRGSLPVEKWCQNWNYSVDAMDPAYQDRVFMDIFDLFFQDPAVVGIRILDYIDKPLKMRDPEDLWTREVDLGLLNQDGSKKPVHDSLKAYWQDQLTHVSGVTDPNGQITLEAAPGIFNVTAGGRTTAVHLHPQDSIFAGPGAETSISLAGESTVEAPTPAQDPPAGEPDDALSLCDLSDDLLGQEVNVPGTLRFVDPGGEGVFFELEDQGCSVGAFVMTSDWNQWPAEVRENLLPGTLVFVTGRLGQFQGIYELEVLGPPLLPE